MLTLGNIVIKKREKGIYYHIATTHNCVGSKIIHRSI